MDAVAGIVLAIIPPVALVALSLINALAFIVRWRKSMTYVDREVLLVLSLACVSYGFSYVVVLRVEQPLVIELQAVLRLSYAVMLAGLTLANFSAIIRYKRDTDSKWTHTFRQQLRSAWRRFLSQLSRHFESLAKMVTMSRHG